MRPFCARQLRFAFTVLAAATVGGLGGCSWFGGGTSEMRVDSRATNDVLEPHFATSIYRFEDPNTCDVYLSDLPLEVLLEAADGRGPGAQGGPGAGNLVRVHMFLTPRAGYTPIDYTASNAAITHIVIASDDTYGVYTGGGFFLPSGTPGDASLSMKTYGTNMRLAGAAGRFNDRLGACEVDAKLTAERNDQAAERIGALVSEMARGTDH